jgi:hypothetical protein
MAKKVPLHDGGFAIVDDEDFDRVVDFRWYRNAYGYAVLCNGVSLHSKIIGRNPPGFVTDHKNENRLDNRKENLRFVTKKLNNLNSSKRKWIMVHQGKWRVRFKVGEMMIDISGIATEPEARSIAHLVKGSLIYHELTKGKTCGIG